MAKTDPLARSLSELTAYPLQVTEALVAPAGDQARGGEDLERAVDTMLRQVLGGRTRTDDATGFRAALTRSFTPEEVDGRRIYRLSPRTLALATAADGDISGVQVSLLARAGDVVERALPMLDGLQPLRPASDAEDARAVVAVIRSSVLRLRDELGRRDGPRVSLVDEHWRILLGEAADRDAVPDPDTVGGALGSLRDLLGLWSQPVLPLAQRNGGPGNRATTADEEQQITNYRVVADYIVGLWQAWRSAAGSFRVDGLARFPLVGVRARQLELTFATIQEAVERVRSSLDSVFVGESERRLLYPPLASRPDERLSVEDLLSWAAELVGPDAATMVRDGGRIAIGDYLLPNARSLSTLLSEAAAAELPGGYGAARVRAALDELSGQFGTLVTELDRLVPPADGVGGGPGNGPGGGQGGGPVLAVLVPDVVGDRLADAVAGLRHSELTAELGDAVPGEPAQEVVSTEPLPGSVVARGSTVLLNYGTGPQPTQVPELVGLTVAQARDRLEEADLEVGAVRYDDDEDVPAGRVVESDPEGGDVVLTGEEVRLVVSSGPDDDPFAVICQAAPLVADTVQEWRAALSKLWQAATGDGEDCDEQLRHAAESLNDAFQVVAELVRDGGLGAARRLQQEQTEREDERRRAAAEAERASPDVREAERLRPPEEAERTSPERAAVADQLFDRPPSTRPAQPVEEVVTVELPEENPAEMPVREVMRRFDAGLLDAKQIRRAEEGRPDGPRKTILDRFREPDIDSGGDSSEVK